MKFYQVGCVLVLLLANACGDDDACECPLGECVDNVCYMQPDGGPSPDVVARPDVPIVVEDAGADAFDAGSVCLNCCESDADCSAPTAFCDPFAGQCVACFVDTDCTDDNECTSDACSEGACTYVASAGGSDCAGGVCNGDAAEPMCIQCLDDDMCSGDTARCDVASGTCVACLSPAECDDGNECTSDACTSGVCSNNTLAVSSACSGGVCDGSSPPLCTECVDNSQCEGATPSCISGSCAQCATNSDCDDGNECTSDSCGGGTCTNTASATGSACAAGVCSAATECVECIGSAQCALSAPVCESASNQCVECVVDADCLASGATCGPTNTCLSCVGPTCEGVPEHRWALTIDGGTGYDQGRAIAVDSLGNVIVTGPFNGSFSLTIGGVVTSYSSRGESDVFVVKFDDAGTPLWARTFGSTSYDSCRGVATDSDNNIYLTGQYQGTGVNVGGLDLPHGLNDGKNAFVVSLSAAGAHRWSHGYRGDGTESGNGIAVANDDVWVVGHFVEDMALPDAGLTRPVRSAGLRDAWVLNLSRVDGSANWRRTYGGVGNETAVAVAVTPANGKAYITGNFASTVVFGAAGPLSADGDSDLFVLKINPDGEERRLQSIGGVASATVGRGIAIGPDRGVVVAGRFSGAVRFGGILETSAGTDGMMFAMDSDLVYQWHTVLGGALNDGAYGIATGASGQVFAIGQFEGTMSVGGDTLVSVGESDVFVVSADVVGGTHHWARSFGSSGADLGWGAALFGDTLFVTGAVRGDTDFGSGVVSASTDGDIFLSAYRTR